MRLSVYTSRHPHFFSPAIIKNYKLNPPYLTKTILFFLSCISQNRKRKRNKFLCLFHLSYIKYKKKKKININVAIILIFLGEQKLNFLVRQEFIHSSKSIKLGLNIHLFGWIQKDFHRLCTILSVRHTFTNNFCWKN